MKTTIKLDGFRELESMLKDLKPVTAKGVARRSQKKVLAPIAEAAQRMGPKHRDGSPFNVAVKARSARDLLADGINPKPGEVFMFAGPVNEPLAHLFENGTVERVQSTTGRSTGRMMMQPFMRPAWDQHKNGLLDRLRDVLKIEIDKSLARAARKAAVEAAKL